MDIDTAEWKKRALEAESMIDQIDELRTAAIEWDAAQKAHEESPQLYSSQRRDQALDAKYRLLAAATRIAKIAKED